MTPTILMICVYGVLLIALSGGIVAYHPRPRWHDFWQMLAILVLASGIFLTGIWIFLQVATAILSRMG